MNEEIPRNDSQKELNRVRNSQNNNQKSISRSTIIAGGIVLCAFIIGLITVMLFSTEKSNLNRDLKNNKVDIVANGQKQNDELADWKVYQNEAIGLEFKYPPQWIISANGYTYDRKSEPFVLDMYFYSNGPPDTTIGLKRSCDIQVEGDFTTSKKESKILIDNSEAKRTDVYDRRGTLCSIVFEKDWVRGVAKKLNLTLMLANEVDEISTQSFIQTIKKIPVRSFALSDVQELALLTEHVAYSREIYISRDGFGQARGGAEGGGGYFYKKEFTKEETEHLFLEVIKMFPNLKTQLASNSDPNSKYYTLALSFQQGLLSKGFHPNAMPGLVEYVPCVEIVCDKKFLNVMLQINDFWDKSGKSQ